MSLPAIEDTPEKFRDWLHSLPPGHVFEPHKGPGCTEPLWRCGCPLASKLRADGAKDPSVDASSWTADSNGRCSYSPTPTWAQDFIRKFDSLYSERNLTPTVARAIRILDGCEPSKDPYKDTSE